MENKTLIGLFALMITGIVGIGIVTAHGSGYGMRGGYGMLGEDTQDRYADMHEVIDTVFESGTLADLEALREEYQMPIMYWVESEEDFNLAKQMHDRFEGNDHGMMGYRGMPCHGWN